MSTQTESIASLGARLTGPADRETYAALINYADSLPEGDEFRKLVQLLGLHTLLIQRVPDSVSELIRELQALPDRVTVDASEIAASVRDLRSMSDQVQVILESFGSRTKSLSATISNELATLQTAASRLQDHNTRLLIQGQSAGQWLKVLLGVLLFLAGVLGGLTIGVHLHWMG